MCDPAKGCLNYQIADVYEIEVECKDAFGSSDKKVLTLYVDVNEAPEILNLPGIFCLFNPLYTKGFFLLVFSISLHKFHS